MPHLIVDFSDNLTLDVKELLSECHQFLVETASAQLKDCKSRASKNSLYLLGDGNSKNSYFHVQVLLMEGRSKTIRQEVGKKLLATIEKCLNSDDMKVQITVIVSEITKDFYFKKS